MDVLAVKAAGEKAVAACRAGKGPYILEVMTYRYRGHSMSDPAKYRTREEVQKMREKRDAIEHVRQLLLTGKHASEDDLKRIDKEIKDIVNEAAEFAKESPEPALEELWTDIYARRRAGDLGVSTPSWVRPRCPVFRATDMATEILMPALSPTMEEGTLAKWLVKEGDTVSAGDILAEIETDKATMEFEAVDEGVMGKILVAEGTEGVKVNTPIAMLVEEGEDVPAAGAPSRMRRGRRHRPPKPHAAAPRSGPQPPPPRRNPTPPPTGPRCRDGQDRPSARRCAMPWPRRCAATTPSS
jgi:biotin carboxyl carrier protein